MGLLQNSGKLCLLTQLWNNLPTLSSWAWFFPFFPAISMSLPSPVSCLFNPFPLCTTYRDLFLRLCMNTQSPFQLNFCCLCPCSSLLFSPLPFFPVVAQHLCLKTMSVR